MNTIESMKIVVAITGASGVEYGIELLKALKQKKVETFLVMSRWAGEVIRKEADHDPEKIKKMADHVFDNKDMAASIASSSFLVDGMVVVPATVKTCSEIAHAHCGTLISKAADNMLKMRRPLVVCVRDTPLSGPALEAMHKISIAGGVVMPLSPGFYHRPKDINDMFKFMTGKILDVLGIDNKEFKRWK